ncbi:MAG: PAS domain S-box protein [Ignavibacteriaceae bacterium]|nr:PAS domain S-box protein [Ignavibacteriaceae bacterium]
MSSEYKINSNLFDSLNEVIANPFMLMDKVGNVLSFNKEAGLLFQFGKNKNNIYDKIDDSSSEFVNSMIEKLLADSGPITQFINLTLKSGLEIKGEVLLNIFNEQHDNFILFSLARNQLNASLSLLQISVQNMDIGNIISNTEIQNIVEEVRNNYPFSLIGRESLRNKIDKLDEPFWIEDSNGNYLIVNNSLSKYTGFQAKQMEGKKANNFLITALHSMYESINNYIKESGNSVTIKGMPFKGINNSSLYETIIFPLFDSMHNFIVSIGITQRIAPVNENFPVNINFFPCAAAYINELSEIVILNSNFESLLNMGNDILIKKNYKDVFPTELINRIKDFREENINELKLKFSGKFDIDKGISESFDVYLYKIYSSVHEPEGLLILIEKDSSTYNFENLINKRGSMLDILIQNNPEPIFIYDTENLGFLEVNNAALNLYGYKKEEFLMMDFTDLYSPEDIQTLLDSSNTPDKFGKFTGPYKHKKKDGASVFVEISKFQFKFNDKDTHFNIIRDVTQKLETEKREQLYKSAFDNSQNLLFVTDSTGFISYVNQPVLDTLLYSRSDIENSSFASLVKNDDRGTVTTSIFQSHLTEPVSLIMELKKGDGTYIDTQLTATPIQNYKGEIDTFTIIGKIESQVIVKEIIKEVVKEVEVEKPVYNNDSIVAPLPGKSMDEDFLSNMFHEILTPINVIIGFVQELTENSQGLTLEQTEAAEIINQNRATLLETMNSIIEFSSIEKNNYEIKPQDISITEIIDFLQKDIEELSGIKGVDFAYGKISSSLRFESDKVKFQHFISLLLKLTAHLTKDKKIYFSAYQADQKEFVVSIKDNYSFVSEYLMDNLKMLFENSEVGKGKDFGISRLTLKLAKRLLGLLKGRFEILSKGDKADYGFVFPLNYSVTPQIKSEPVSRIEQEERHLTDNEIKKEKPKPRITEEGYEEVPSSGIIVNKYNFWESGAEDQDSAVFDEELNGLEKEIDKVQPFKQSDKLDLSRLSCLYLEDQVDSQILFKVQMKELKSIKFAASYEEALPLLDNEHFDFIVIDINLQGEYNGLDNLKIIRNMPEFADTPIIAVTAYVLPGDKEKFVAAGFQDFISKPIFREKMVDSLERIFLS